METERLVNFVNASTLVMSRSRISFPLELSSLLCKFLSGESFSLYFSSTYGSEDSKGRSCGYILLRF